MAAVKTLSPIAVLMRMLPVGRNLEPGALLAHWRQLAWQTWIRLVFATFLLPPLLISGHRYLHNKNALPAIACSLTPSAPLGRVDDAKHARFPEVESDAVARVQSTLL